MPTHRVIHDQAKDLIVYQQLLKQAEASLNKLESTPGIKDLLQTLHQLKDHQPIWNHQLDGLAIFASDQEMIMYQTRTTFTPFAVVADSFHLKPLYAYFQHQEMFHFLALEADRFAMYEGNVHVIHSLPLPEGTKMTLKEVLGSQVTENYQTNGVYGGSMVGSNFHGHGGKKDDMAIDKEKYFRYVDRLVYEIFSKPNPVPLIVITPKDHQAVFVQVAKNPYILSTMIDGSFQTIVSTHLQTDLKAITEARFLKGVHHTIEQYHQQVQHHLGSHDVDIVAQALMQGRVDTLMLQKDYVLSGHLNEEQQTIHRWPIEEPHTDDVLDDMLQLALTKGTKVYILDATIMPSTSGVAAIFRY
jgi:hypothetical protein